MAQLAYRCDDTPQAPAPWAGEIAVTVSLFGDSAELLALMATDAQSAGLVPGVARPLDSLLDANTGPLGDIVLVDCSDCAGAKLAALVRLDERAARSGAHLVVSTGRDALEDVFGCLELARPILLVRPSRAERLVALGEALSRLPGHRVREMDE